MANNRTMMMALGKLGKKSAPADDEGDASPKKGMALASDDEPDDEDEGDEKEPDEKKSTFMDMCKAIRDGDDDKAYELYQDCEGM